MQLRAALADRTPYRKFLIIVGIMLISAVVFSALGTLFSKLFFGIDVTADSLLPGDAGSDTVGAVRLFQAIAAIGTFILASFTAAFLFTENPFGYLGLTVRPDRQALLLVTVLFLAAIPFINWMMMVNADLHLPASMSAVEEWMKVSEEQATRLTELLLGGTSWMDLLANLFVVALIPAVGEELFFRGLVQRQFQELAGNRIAAVVLTAFVFSALHMQFFGFLPRFALGIVLGLLYSWSGSIWLPVLAHFVNNATSVLLAWISARVTLGWNPDTIGTEEGQLWLLAASVFCTWGVLMLISRLYAGGNK